MPFEIQDIINGINIVAILVILSCALIGFMRSTKKSVFYFVASIVFIGGGLLLSNVICNFLLNYDLSVYNLSFSANGVNYNVVTINDTLTAVLKDYIFGEANIEGTITVNVFIGLVQMIFRIIWFIVLMVLSFTLFYWISGIIWLIIKPKKKNGLKPKKTISGRFCGAGIGAVKGLAYVLLLFFIIAGLASIMETVDDISNSLDDESTYNLVLTDGTATLVELESQNNNNIFGEYQEVIDYLMSYKDSIPGKVFGTIAIDGTSIDEFIFDSFFEINIEGTNSKIQLRKELECVARALAEFPEILSGEITFEKLLEYSKDEATNARMKAAISELSSLEIINVIMPVAIEVVV